MKMNEFEAFKFWGFLVSTDEVWAASCGAIKVSTVQRPCRTSGRYKSISVQLRAIDPGGTRFVEGTKTKDQKLKIKALLNYPSNRISLGEGRKTGDKRDEKVSLCF